MERSIVRCRTAWRTLANHNLISFKSHQDTFDFWTLLELIGHYVNYRKQASPSLDQLLPENQFRLFAITARFPEGLATQIPLEESQPGVYDINIGPLQIRLLVVRNLADEPANAMLKLFSIVPEQIEFACRYYRPVSQHTTGIVDNLIRVYRKEDMSMASTLEELNQKILKEALETASIDDRLKGLSPDDRLKGLTAEQILKRFSPDDRLKGLTTEEIEAYLRTLKNEKQKGD